MLGGHPPVHQYRSLNLFLARGFYVLLKPDRLFHSSGKVFELFYAGL